VSSSSVTKLTEQEYLALDRAAEIRSEFLDGEMFAMSGGSSRHVFLHANLLAEMHAALRGGQCRVGGPDFRVRVSATGMYAYPDLVVICGKLLLADAHQDILLNPAIIFEILSPSTEKYDRGSKFQHYRTIESLREYVLVDQNQVQIEQYVRQPDNTWTFRDYQGLDAKLKLDSIGVTLPLQRIYDRVDITGL
jgi:Uma2 family endonuclease